MYDIILLVVGAFLGLSITLLWEKYRDIRKNRRYAKSYSKYEGVYLAFSKYDTSEDKALKYLEIVREKNCFNIVLGISLQGHEDFTGRITMSETIHNYGKGYCQHERDKHNIKNEILIHESIYNDKGDQNSDGYRWIKQNITRKDEIFFMCRQKQQKKLASR